VVGDSFVLVGAVVVVAAASLSLPEKLVVSHEIWHMEKMMGLTGT
jgi:hypothetical protein